MRGSERRSAARMAALGGWVCTCAVGLVAVARVGAADPGSPPLGDPTSWPEWWTQRPALDAVVGCTRLLVGLALGYLALATALQLLAAAVGGARLHRRASRLGPRFLAGLTAAVVLGAAPAGADTTTGPAAPGDPAVPATPVTMELVTPDGGTTAGASTWLPWADGPPIASTATPTRAPLPPAERVVTVRAGDHFWSLAEAEVTARLGRAPTDAEVAGCWRQMVALNRDALVDPDNPDLILPGQVFRLP